MIARYSLISLVCHGLLGGVLLLKFVPSPQKSLATEINVVESQSSVAAKAMERQVQVTKHTQALKVQIGSSAATRTVIESPTQNYPETAEVGEINATTPGKLSQYYMEIRSKVANQQVYPRIARMQGLSGRVLVIFELAKNGNIVEAKVQSSSGYEILDRSAVEAVKSAQPFPVFPEFFNRESVRVEIPLVYDLRI